ncbi:hypothetical protein BC01_190 [Bacillus phage BC01]|nr:hypothetical protein PBC6_176 [Bacillus phage PBC6]AXU41287.1 hypothetical protein BC01_190 [Bacillus phage BC01]
MRLVSVLDHGIKLQLSTTDQETYTILVPKKDIHFWYPFNLGFYYKYSAAKEYMYLVKDKHYDLGNVYGTDILKRTKELPINEDDVPFNEPVYNRNVCVMDKARLMGIPTVTDNYDLNQVEHGFKTVSDQMQYIKERMEERYMEKYITKIESYQPVQQTEEWDKQVYRCAQAAEMEELGWLSEIYNMLVLMKKLLTKGE